MYYMVLLHFRHENRILRYCTQVVLGHVLLKFVQMVVPPTLSVKSYPKTISTQLI